MISGAIVQIASGRTIGDTDLGTALVAIPGTLLGLAAIYALGFAASAWRASTRRPRRGATPAASHREADQAGIRSVVWSQSRWRHQGRPAESPARICEGRSSVLARS